MRQSAQVKRNIAERRTRRNLARRHNTKQVLSHKTKVARCYPPKPIRKDAEA
jgi:hypothetical protein